MVLLISRTFCKPVRSKTVGSGRTQTPVHSPGDYFEPYPSSRLGNWSSSVPLSGSAPESDVPTRLVLTVYGPSFRPKCLARRNLWWIVRGTLVFGRDSPWLETQGGPTPQRTHTPWVLRKSAGVDVWPVCRNRCRPKRSGRSRGVPVCSVDLPQGPRPWTSGRPFVWTVVDYGRATRTHQRSYTLLVLSLLSQVWVHPLCVEWRFWLRVRLSGVFNQVEVLKLLT